MMMIIKCVYKGERNAPVGLPLPHVHWRSSYAPRPTQQNSSFICPGKRATTPAQVGAAPSSISNQTHLSLGPPTPQPKLLRRGAWSNMDIYFVLIDVHFTLHGNNRARWVNAHRPHLVHLPCLTSAKCDVLCALLGFSVYLPMSDFMRSNNEHDSRNGKKVLPRFCS